MTRECQVRICEGLGVKFPGPTRRRHLETVLRVCVPTLLLWSDSGAATSGAQRGGKPGRPLREAMAIKREQLRGGKGTEQELLAFVAYLTPVEGEDHGQADRYGRDRRH
jgi:hypothetical protein